MTEAYSLNDLLTRHSLAFKLENGQLVGEGADFLQTAMQSSQFFMIGEEHGVAEIPLATSALFQTAVNCGYNHLAIETGPLITEDISNALMRNGRQGLIDFIQADPLMVPFYSWKEDIQLLHAAYAASENKATFLWGVDQENMFSACHLLQQVLDLAQHANAKTKASQVLNQAHKLRREGIPGLFVVQEASFAELQLLAAHDNKTAVHILKALETSYNIYKLFGQAMQGRIEAEYENNAARESLIKKTFLRFYEQAVKKNKNQGLPKVMLRMGASHLCRGQAQSKVFSLGNLLFELAIYNKSNAFNIFMMAGLGTEVQSAFEGHQPAQNAKAMGLGPVLKICDTSAWTLFDLRPLRSVLFAGKLADIDPELEQAIWQWDAMVVFSGSRPATNLV